MRSTIAALAIAAGASTVMADTVQLRTLGLVSGAGGSANVTSVLRDGPGATSRTVFAGQIHHKLGAGGTKDLYTFCTEIAQTTSSSLKTFNVERELKDAPDPDGPMGKDKADAIGRMYRYAVTDAGFDVFDKLESTGDTSVADFAVAFQLAIWEVVEDYDGTTVSLDSGDGDFTVQEFSTISSTSTTEDGVSDFFNTLIGVAGNTTLAIESRLGALTHGGHQDQIIMVPLPTSAGLAAVGFFGVVLAGRRRFV